MECSSCNMKFDELSFHQIFFMEECCHIVCKRCIVGIINENFPDEVKCPSRDCERIIQNFEIQGILGQEAFDELNKKALN